VRVFTRRDLRALGTGNVGVSAAFIHGGKLAGIAAVLAEIARGIVRFWRGDFASRMHRRSRSPC
jgi:pyruvate,water dikinase